MDDFSAATIDAWCQKRINRLTADCAAHLVSSGDLNDPDYRAKLGEHRAYMAMRSFIHGARNLPPHDPPAPSEAQADNGDPERQGDVGG